MSPDTNERGALYKPSDERSNGGSSDKFLTCAEAINTHHASATYPCSQLLRIRTMDNGAPKSDCLCSFSHIMEAVNLRAAIKSGERRRERTRQSMCRILAAAEPADKALAGNAQQQATAASDQPETEATETVAEPPPSEMPTRDMNQT